MVSSRFARILILVSITGVPHSQFLEVANGIPIKLPSLPLARVGSPVYLSMLPLHLEHLAHIDETLLLQAFSTFQSQCSVQLVPLEELWMFRSRMHAHERLLMPSRTISMPLLQSLPSKGCHLRSSCQYLGVDLGLQQRHTDRNLILAGFDEGRDRTTIGWLYIPRFAGSWLSECNTGPCVSIVLPSQSKHPCSTSLSSGDQSDFVWRGMIDNSPST